MKFSHSDAKTAFMLMTSAFLQKASAFLLFGRIFYVFISCAHFSCGVIFFCNL